MVEEIIMRLLWVITSAFPLLTATAASAQKLPVRIAGPTPLHTLTKDRNDLEKERSAIQKEIEGVKGSLAKTHAHHREFLAQLAFLQQQLSIRESRIRNLNGQVALISSRMKESGRETGNLQRQLDSLRARYAENIVLAYKSRDSYDYLSFIFSASSFNDALVRMQYLRSYQAYRTAEADDLRRSEQLLARKIDALKATKLEKEAVLEKENTARRQLGDEKKQKTAIVSRLQGQEEVMEKRIAARQRQDRNLSAAIAAILAKARREAAAGRDRSVKKMAPEAGKATAPVRDAAGKSAVKKITAEAAKPKAGPVTTPLFDNLPMTQRFEKYRGSLPWPVESQEIAMAFGRYVYGGHGPNGDNRGLTITVAAGSVVKAVFDGEVQAVFPVEEVEAVMIRHGNYFTTYSNLSAATVKKGDIVKMGQVLGQVAEIGQLEFIISDEKDQRFDPAKWLKR